MSHFALLVEELTEATGVSRQRIIGFLDAIEESFGNGTDALKQRVGSIMARSGPMEDRFSDVVSVTEANLDGPMKSRLFAALGLGVLGGFVLAGATTVLATIVGVVLLCMSGYMIISVVRKATNQVRDMIEAF